MSEYPKRCTMEEAIEAVKAGGKARLRGELEREWTRIRRTKSGDACYRYDNGALCYSVGFLKCWIYEITKPAPVADQSSTRTYTTAEAVAEVLRSGEEMVGTRTGSVFTMKLDNIGDIVCSDTAGPFQYIPVNCTEWTKKKIAKPDAFSGDVTLPKGAAMTAPVNDICAMQSKWPGKVRVQWTVEAVD